MLIYQSSCGEVAPKFYLWGLAAKRLVSQLTELVEEIGGSIATESANQCTCFTVKLAIAPQLKNYENP
ncbi:MAG: hypothetical protein V7L14_26055 [Nostoc sp.]|uniref:hypothetical protein n=1 Tax=Nostoc sp. TaxID=1180 RepID=UPI002FF84457